MERKYCYRCGRPYKTDACPNDGTTLHTKSPNSMTRLYVKRLKAKMTPRVMV